MSKTLTWLHISDLHIGKPGASWDADRVIETLKNDLSKMEHDQSLHPDLIFFTGDIAFGQFGSKEEQTLAGQFNIANNFFSSVQKAFSPEVPSSNMFFVPGNHDVNRYLVGADQTAWLDSLKDPVQINDLLEKIPPQWQRYMERLQAYKDFLSKNQYSHLLEDPDRLVYGVMHYKDDIAIGIGGFNTAWSCCRDGEKGKLWMGGKWQIAGVRSKIKKANISIALLHHPANWLNEYEDPECKRDLERDFHFILHGHEHRDWVIPGTNSTTIAAGACYERSDKENGYNFVRLDLETGNCEVWLRTYDHKGAGWIPCIIHNKTDNNGMWSLGVLQTLDIAKHHKSSNSKQRIKLYLEGDYSSLSLEQRSAMIEAIALIMQIPSREIEIYKVSPGSIVLDLGVPTEAIDSLRSALTSGSQALRLLKTAKVIIEDNSTDVVEEWISESGKYYSAQSSKSALTVMSIAPYSESEQIERLKANVGNWNIWRNENPNHVINLYQANLRGTFLIGANLSNANLQRADLSNTYLMGTTLTGANLTEANLRGANLSEARLTGANLNRANLSDAFLRAADLSDTSLRGSFLVSINLDRANLTGTDLRGANLSGAHFGFTTLARLDLSDVNGLESTSHGGASSVSIDTLQLSSGKIPESFLRGCGLSDLEIEIAKLYNPDLTNEEIIKIQYRIYELRATNALQISPLFISYSHADSSFVDQLGSALSEKGIRYWRDVHDAMAGRLETQINHAIRQNPTVLLILSKSSIQSDWIEHEVRTARALEKELGRDTLCPIAIDESWKTGNLPKRVLEQVMEYNILDFSNWQDSSIFDAKIPKLLNGLNIFYRTSK